MFVTCEDMSCIFFHNTTCNTSFFDSLPLTITLLQVQQILLVAPNNTGGTFNLTTPDGRVTSPNIVFLANASTVAAAVLSLGLAPTVNVVYNHTLLPNGTDVCVWTLTYPILTPVPVPHIVVDGLLFPGVVYSINELKRGVTPFDGSWTISLPYLSSSTTDPIPYNANASTVLAALQSLTFPAVYGALEVLSVSQDTTYGPQTDFQGAGSTHWSWVITCRLHPFDGIDPNGRIGDFYVNGSGLIGGYGVAISDVHTIVGQAGLEPASGSIAVGNSAGDSVTIPVTALVSEVTSLIGSLPGVDIQGVEVLTQPGWWANDNGYSRVTGYGFGLQNVLDGLGSSITWLITYVPSDMIDVCTNTGAVSFEPFLTFSTPGLFGSNVTSAASPLQSTSCTAVDMPVLSHSNTNIRAHLPALAGLLPTFPQYYSGLNGAPSPAGWWRAPSLGYTGEYTGGINNIGWFGGAADIVGDIAESPGFSARDPSPSLVLQGASSYISIPYRYETYYHCLCFYWHLIRIPDCVFTPRLLGIAGASTTLPPSPLSCGCGRPRCLPLPSSPSPPLFLIFCTRLLWVTRCGWTRADVCLVGSAAATALSRFPLALA